MTTTPTTDTKPGFWSNMSDLFSLITVGIGTATKAVTAVDDIVTAAQAQTALIKDTSIADADLKRLDLEDRMTARIAQRRTENKD